MKKTLFTIVLPVVAILVGIGLVIGSFHAQTKTVPAHNPVAAQSVSAGSSTPGTSSSSGKPKQQDGNPGTSKASGQQASSATSSGSKDSSSTSFKTTGSSASGTTASAAGSKTSTGSTQVKTSGKKASTGTTSESHATSAALSPSGTSSASSRSVSKQSSVSVSIQGLNGFNTSGLTAYHSGDSIFTELQQFTQAKGIQLGYSGFGSSIYISSINNQNASQTSPSSGWMYTVNGKQPNLSAGAYKPNAGDKIVWYYTK